MSGKHLSYKNFGNEQGWSCCFRQWKAKHSHCSLLHGYALGVKFEFMSDCLDDKNWVMDFGGFKEVKKWLENLLDHTMLVSEDDPFKDDICMLAGIGIANVIVLPNVGCEALAQYIHEWVARWTKIQTQGRVDLYKTTVYEHGANGASYVSL
ncbi:MAG TPA: 6-carboxytetrahydropterin synthase [Nitrospira sp.]|nr:6-carboxytetrahydropterin synthase [Nitrospira sp.]